MAEARGFFIALKDKVEADRSLLEDLLERIGQHPIFLLKVAAGMAARGGGLELMWEQVEPGELGLFKAFEMLVLGISGKPLLWIALKEIAPSFPEWDGIDFSELEKQALAQCEEAELWRVRAANPVFVKGEGRSALGTQ